jgi:hypothetical protein
LHKSAVVVWMRLLGAGPSFFREVSHERFLACHRDKAAMRR